MTIVELIAALEVRDEVLAARLGVSAGTVARWRKGRKVPTPMARFALCKRAGVKVSDVVWKREV